ncbi:TlpA disulfide reductase family protein [Pontibacter sp. H249]|uniref:TlpA disulfide reductase family protein n=1 Tax=Pontibacter sp. H249 TaxID=3133420 RepID=UPI0030BECE56
MKAIPKLVVLVLLLMSCAKREVPEEIFIEGFVNDVPDGTVYLTHSHDPKEFLDSAEVIDNHFRFAIKLDSTFVPFRASIHYRDSTFAENNYIRRILYLNSQQSTEKTKSGSDSFFQGKTSTTIKVNPDLPRLHHIQSGKDNLLSERFMNKGFGYLHISDSTKRAARLKYYEKEIKQNPDSYFLLSEVYLNREDYTKRELSNLLTHFNQEVQGSRSAKSVRSYLANRTDPDRPYPNLQLSTPQNERQRILNTSARVNLLVFWASWCGPCRKEIPELKEVNLSFKERGLNMVSISIDEEQSNWHKALDKEQMEWQQFIVEKDKAELIKQQFNFSSIPLMLLTDSNGKEIKRISGYSKDNVARLKVAITQQLSGS